MNHGGLLPLFGMWAAMMIAMMAPAEAPSVLRLRRGRLAFAAGFAAPWIAFSFAAALLQQWLHGAGLLEHASGALRNPWLAAAVLAAAGAAQFTPLKRACRLSPLEGSLRGGLRAAAFSIGSCGVLMLAPFAVGMSMWPMALITALLVAEKWAPQRWPVSAVSGVLLAASGALLAL
ncbi:MAG TPA: DUF2182 domain-containing protein [Myxococcales bacterium]|nr:DUF2182 domain-containing protein [Myxococcales bacterium]